MNDTKHIPRQLFIHGFHFKGYWNETMCYYYGVIDDFHSKVFIIEKLFIHPPAALSIKCLITCYYVNSGKYSINMND